MLLKFTIENFEVFQKPVELSMEANLHTRKFLSNVVQSDQGNALKSIAIYGPNNTGKTARSDIVPMYSQNPQLLILAQNFSLTEVDLPIPLLMTQRQKNTKKSILAVLR